MEKIQEAVIRNFQAYSEQSLSRQKICNMILQDYVSLTQSKIGFIMALRGDTAYCEALLLENDDDVNISCENACENANLKNDSVKIKSSCALAMFDHNMENILTSIINNRQHVIHNSITDDMENNFPDGHPKIKRFLGIPLFFKDKLSAVVALANRKTNYPENIINDINIFTMTCANILGGQSLMDEITKRNTEKIKIAQQIATAKGAFLANMSHEIRTPLNGIIGMTRILQEAELSSEHTSYVSIIHQCGVQLLGIINDILDFSKMACGKLKLDEKDFSVRECIEAAYDINLLKAREKQIDISYIISPSIPRKVNGDAKRLCQIIVNLLSNAIKFTPDGGKVVTMVNASQMYSDGTYLFTISVKDSGIGIAPESYENIFQSFTQVDNTITRSHDGTGLGLAICQMLVGLMDGDISVSSVIGEGSKFTFHIKLNVVKDNHLLEHDTDISILHNKVVLIVDDNATNRIMMCNLVMGCGMMPIMCSSAQEAIMYAQSGTYFDIGLIDMCMPEISGYELAKELFKIYPNPPLLIAMSSIDSLNHDESLFKFSLLKPIKQSQLLKNIKQLLIDPTQSLNKKREYSNSKDQKEYIKENGEEINNKNFQKNNNSADNSPILIVEDSPHNQAVARAILKELHYTNVTSAYNGLEALNILKSQKNHYKIIFMDLKMPIMDGYTATKEIINLYGENEYPPVIVALTATVLESDKEKCREYGMSAFISKPIDSEEVKAMCNAILYPGKITHTKHKFNLKNITLKPFENNDLNHTTSSEVRERQSLGSLTSHI